MLSLATPRASPSSLASMHVDERERDVVGLALPRPEVRVVARFGPMARGGLDVHALGIRQTAHRKTVRGGQRTVVARLQPGTTEAVFGVPASALSRDHVALEDLWGRDTAQQLDAHLRDAPDAHAAARVLERALASRSAGNLGPHVRLARAAAQRLVHANVGQVATELGVSERQLRRVFHEHLGLAPKEFAKLARFHRALDAARAGEPSWASIATDAGYYDQAHLIAEFRAITGVTPRALLRELQVAPMLG